MAEHVGSDRFHILQAWRGSSLQRRPGLAAQHQVLRGPGAGAPGDHLANERWSVRVVRPGAAGEPHGVVHDRWWGRHSPDQRLELPEPLAVDHGLDRPGSRRRRYRGNLAFLLEGGVRDPQLEHEAVELGLGERVRALMLDRILGREDEKWWLEGECLGSHRYRQLLHGLQQRGLGLGRRPVDLVGQDHIGEYRAAHEPEHPASGLRILLEHVGARDVGRHEIRSELNATEPEIERLGESRDQRGLGQAGNSHDKRVAAGQQGDQQLLDDLLLPHDAPRYLALQVLPGARQVLQQLDVVPARHDPHPPTAGHPRSPPVRSLSSRWTEARSYPVRASSRQSCGYFHKRV